MASAAARGARAELLTGPSLRNALGVVGGGGGGGFELERRRQRQAPTFPPYGLLRGLIQPRRQIK